MPGSGTEDTGTAADSVSEQRALEDKGGSDDSDIVDIVDGSDLSNEELIFSDDFEGDLAAWTSVAGKWAIDGGELVQSDDVETRTFSYVHGLAETQNYRVVTRMRQLSGDEGGAMEISFRLSTTNTRKQYFCNWQPNNGLFLIMLSDDKDYSEDLRSFFVDLKQNPDYDPLAPVTMELIAEGSLFRCRLLEIPDAHIVLTHTAYAAGVVGVKTYKMAAAFDAFRVYRR